LTKEVKAGENTIDFDLKSDGPVLQPEALEKMSKMKQQDEC
jgi:hypothetical protein